MQGIKQQYALQQFFYDFFLRRFYMQNTCVPKEHLPFSL